MNMRTSLGSASRAAGIGLLSALLLLAPVNLGAAPRDHVIVWMPPGGVVDGYRVQVGPRSSLYDQVIDLGVVPIDPDGLGRATLTLDSSFDYYVSLIAYNSAGDSPRSNEIIVAKSMCDPTQCSDTESCTADDCGPNGCTHTPVPDGTYCSAGPYAAGMCSAGACLPAQCTQASHCDDGNKCNGAESCSVTGSCSAGTPLSCGAPKQCSIPSCDPVLGCIEVARPDGTLCNDGRRNTRGDRCVSGQCRGTKIVRK
jgi:hypothetical protein